MNELIDDIEQAFGKLSDDRIETFVWHCTSYPAGKIEDWRRQTTELAVKASGDYDKAMEIAYQEIQDAVAQINLDNNIRITDVHPDDLPI